MSCTFQNKVLARNKL